MEIRLQITHWQDYLGLTKPRVILLHLVTTAAAMFLAAGGVPSIPTLSCTLIGGTFMVGASNALNCYCDRYLDAEMERTSHRPLPSGRLAPEQARNFSIILAFSGLYILDRFVSLPVAWLSLLALAYYVPCYTLWLKRRTSWSIIIGSGAGAFPPLIGWAAVTGQITLAPFLLFAIIAFWSPPHFWSLALARINEFRRAGIKVLPGKNTALWILLFSILLTTVSLLLTRVTHLGVFYLISAIALNMVFLMLALRLYRQNVLGNARNLHLYSIAYMLLLFIAIAIDRLIF